jgi:hypothetical protein
MRFYQSMMEVDRKARLHNQDRLRALSRDRSKDVRLFCSHDAVEFKAFANPSDSSQNSEISSFGDIANG